MKWSRPLRSGFLAGLVACGIALAGAACSAAPPSAYEPVADQLASTYSPGSLLVIGELHGTEETPAFVLALVRRLAQVQNVALALEIPLQEQARIDTFLASDGGPDARAALLAGTFWQRPVERSDGRRSEAGVALLDAIRRERGKNAVRVVAIDDEGFFAEGADRRAGLAARMVDLRRRSDTEAVVVLLGNYHARRNAPSRVKTEDGERLVPPVPTAALIRDTATTSVEVSACEGAFWTCVSQHRPCGVVDLPVWCESSTAPTLTALTGEGRDYDARVMLPRLTPSAPAR